jgi:hypothetical protein
MGLTVYPLVNFNASTGSDTQASGAGPATAVYGTGCAVTSGSGSVTISDAVDLSGVAQDGSAVLWVLTASGRQFTRISTVAGSSGAWTLTVEDTAWTSGSSKTWAIGGKRATWDNANSRTLFGSTGAKAGWTIQTETDQTLNTTTLSITAAGSVTVGAITIQGSSDTTPSTIKQTANVAAFTTNTVGLIVYKNLKIVNSNVSKTSANGLSTITTNSQQYVFISCIFGDSVYTLNDCVYLGNATSARFIDCVFFNGSVGLYCYSINNVEIHNSVISNNSSYGIYDNGTGRLIIRNCLIYSNGYGIYSNYATTSDHYNIVGCTIHGNTSGGIYCNQASNYYAAVIHSNNITGNGGYGIVGLSGTTDFLKAIIDYNNFGYGVGIANSSGAMQYITAGGHDLAVDPMYGNAAGGDFSVHNPALSAAGFPGSGRTVGAGQSATYDYVDIGAQRQPVIVYPAAGQLFH